MPHEKTLQLYRTATPNNAPTGLAHGELAVEMASAPPKLWCGVPATIDATGRIRLSSPTAASATAPTTPSLGDLWYDTATGELNIWDGTQWKMIGGDIATLPLAITDGGTGATNAGSALLNLGALPSNNPNFTGTMTGPTILVGFAPNQLSIDSLGHLRVPSGQPLTLGADGASPLSAVTLQQMNAAIAGVGGGGTYIGATPPVSPQVGDLWWRSDDDGNLFVWYDDGTSAQWVAAVPSPAAGPRGPAGAPGAQGPQGIQGIQGPQGIPGADAVEGTWEDFAPYVVGAGTVWNTAPALFDMRIRLINNGTNVQIEGSIRPITALAYGTSTILAQLPPQFQPASSHNAIIFALDGNGAATLSHVAIWPAGGGLAGQMSIMAEYSSLSYVAIASIFGV